MTSGWRRSPLPSPSPRRATDRHHSHPAREGISAFALLEPGHLEAGLDRLAHDLDTGLWERRFGALRARETLDLDYRLLVATR